MLQWQFRLAVGVAPSGGCRGRTGRAHKAPADRGRAPGILPNDDLRGTARAIVSSQEHTVFQIDLVIERLEGPDVAVRQYQHHATAIAEPARLDGGMKVKAHRETGVVALDPGARRRCNAVLAIAPRAIMRKHQRPAVE